mgnify:CR=1 FL=1
MMPDRPTEVKIQAGDITAKNLKMVDEIDHNVTEYRVFDYLMIRSVQY